MAKIPSLIIDLDGTMIECGTFYEQCRVQGAEFLNVTTGLPTRVALDLIHQVDALSAQMTPDFDKERFPTSFRAAYEAAMVMTGTEVTSFTAVNAKMMYDIGNRVYQAPYPLFDGVLSTLETLRAAGWQLVLYTKGDYDVQFGKIRRHDLSKYFDGMVITGRKDLDNIEVLCDTYGVDRHASFMIGDSLRDDIGPANEAGLRTILITDTCSAWSYNDADVEPWLRIPRFHHVPEEVGYGSDTPVGSQEDGGFVALVQPD